MFPAGQAKVNRATHSNSPSSGLALTSLRRWARIVFALALAIALTAPGYAAENLQLIEQQIKAGLLYNFLKYTQWPAEHLRAGGPIQVCLFGGDPFDGRLQPMAGRTVNEHVIEIKIIRAPTEIGDCSLLFVHAGQAPNWPELQKTLNGKSVLTVADFPDFAMAGGMIEFTRVANRIGVTINTDAINAANLQVEDRLLRLAGNARAPAPGR
jgi:hypothetical protein